MVLFVGNFEVVSFTFRFKVRFHDEKELILTATAIVPQELILQGQKICARDCEDGFYYEGTICKIIKYVMMMPLLF